MPRRGLRRLRRATYTISSGKAQHEPGPDLEVSAAKYLAARSSPHDLRESVFLSKRRQHLAGTQCVLVDEYHDPTVKRLGPNPSVMSRTERSRQLLAGVWRNPVKPSGRWRRTQRAEERLPSARPTSPMARNSRAFHLGRQRVASIRMGRRTLQARQCPRANSHLHYGKARTAFNKALRSIESIEQRARSTARRTGRNLRTTRTATRVWVRNHAGGRGDHSIRLRTALGVVRA